MRYIVHTVGEDDLPKGVHRLIVEPKDCDSPPLLLINGEPAKTWRFMRAFEDSREACALPSVLLRAV